MRQTQTNGTPSNRTMRSIYKIIPTSLICTLVFPVAFSYCQAGLNNRLDISPASPILIPFRILFAQAPRAKKPTACRAPPNKKRKVERLLEPIQMKPVHYCSGKLKASILGTTERLRRPTYQNNANKEPTSPRPFPNQDMRGTNAQYNTVTEPVLCVRACKVLSYSHLLPRGSRKAVAPGPGTPPYTPVPPNVLPLACCSKFCLKTLSRRKQIPPPSPNTLNDRCITKTHARKPAGAWPASHLISSHLININAPRTTTNDPTMYLVAIFFFSERVHTSWSFSI